VVAVSGFLVAASAKLQALLDQHRVDLGGLTPGEWLEETPGGSDMLVSGGDLETVPLPLAVRHARIKWANMLFPQVGTGTNVLTLDHTLPEDLFTVWLALPVSTFRESIGAIGMKGWEVVLPVALQPASRPMPDCVILRQTAPHAVLKLREHAREPYIALSLGLEWRMSAIDAPGRLDDVVLLHSDAQGRAAGGFTLRPRIA